MNSSAVEQTEAPSVVSDVVETLRSALEMAEKGEIQAVAISYAGDALGFSYSCESLTAEVACAAQEMAAELRQIVLEG